MGKPTADGAGRDPGDYQHRGTGHAPWARAVIATMVSTSFFPAWANAVPVCFLHYSIVWAVMVGVDVVAHNAARLSVFLRTGCVRCSWCCGDVVDGNTARCDALSEQTSTAGSVRITIDTWAGNLRPTTKNSPPAR
jgi:hypothetical protein